MVGAQSTGGDRRDCWFSGRKRRTVGWLVNVKLTAGVRVKHGASRQVEHSDSVRVDAIHLARRAADLREGTGRANRIIIFKEGRRRGAISRTNSAEYISVGHHGGGGIRRCQSVGNDRPPSPGAWTR